MYLDKDRSATSIIFLCEVFFLVQKNKRDCLEAFVTCTKDVSRERTHNDTTPPYKTIPIPEDNHIVEILIFNPTPQSDSNEQRVANPTMSLSPPQYAIHFNPDEGPGYILNKLLTHGSQGEVYLVTSLYDGRPYVLKNIAHDIRS